MLVDVTKSAENLQDVREHLISGFQWATKRGMLCSEPLRGVRFNCVDVALHKDPSHRNEPATRRALYASQLTAEPTLIEPFNGRRSQHHWQSVETFTPS
jgi:elongation factor 2